MFSSMSPPRLIPALGGTVYKHEAKPPVFISAEPRV